MTATAPPSPRENSHVSVDKKKPSVKSETESTSIPVMAASAGAGANDTVVKQQCTPDQIPTVSDEHAISKESTSSPRTDIADSNIVTLKETPSTEGSSPALPKLQLPPIEHVLQKIDAYQNEQKLFDSQLLLNFKERSNSNSDLEKADELSASDSAFADDVSVTSSNADSASTSMKDLRTMHTVNTTMDISFKSNVPGSRRLSSVDSPNAGTMSVLNIGPDLTKSSRKSSVESTDSLSSSSTTPVSARTPEHQTSSSKKRTNLPRGTIEILNEWVLNNLDNPYPNHTQKRILLEKTGLSNVQLSNWFINKRRRRIFSNLSGNQGQPIKKKRLIDRL